MDQDVTRKSGTPPLRLLVVEDDAALRELFCEMLEEEGFEVVTAADGRVAAELLARDDRFDVLVLDDEMPRLGGRDLLEELRARGRRFPAVFVSGSLELAPEEQAFLGVGPVIRKPVALGRLVEAIRQAAAAPRPP